MFISRTVVGHTEVGKFQTVTPEGSKEFDPNTVLTDFVSHVIVQPNKLSISAVTSKNYPRRVIFEVSVIVNDWLHLFFSGFPPLGDA